MEFNSLVQITHMYLRSNYHFENIILHKRFTQYCRIATSNSDLKSQWNFLTFKDFHPLNDPGGYVQKIWKNMSREVNFWMKNVPHIMTMHNNILACFLLLLKFRVNVDFNLFVENSRFLPQNNSIDIISISLIVFVYQVEVLGYVKFRYENDIC